VDEREAVRKLFEAYPGLFEIVQGALARSCCEVLNSCWKKLFDARWFDLAQHPQDFDREFNKIANELRGLLKTAYGIKPHRPTRNSVRDLEIWNLWWEQKWSLARIGRKVGLKPNAVKSALTRQQRRCQDQDARAGMILEFLADVFREFHRRSAQNSETKLLPEGPVN
jgi:hypothetical protein